jgi:hypothetical protein
MPRRKKNGVNRSEEIRALIEKNPKMKGSEVVQALNERGIKVSGNLVYLVRAKMGHRRRKARRAAAINAGVRNGVPNPVQLILDVRALAERTGGVRQLKQLVDALAG